PPVQTSPAAPGVFGQPIPLTSQPIVLVPLLIALALLFGYLIALYLARRERTELATAQRAIGAALREPGISLSDVPAEIRSLENQMSGFHAQNIDLERKIKQA